MQEMLDRYLSFLKPFTIHIFLGVLGLICLGYGLIVLSHPRDTSRDILLEAASDQSNLAQTKIEDASLIKVDVEGAVQKPGVYKIADSSLVQDALIAAGGLSESADREMVSKNLNLAAKVTDGAKLFIPHAGEELTASGAKAVLGSSSQTININEASSGDLENLPGIRKVTADKIISGRPYDRVEQLSEKKIVNKKVFDQIKDRISVN